MISEIKEKKEGVAPAYFANMKRVSMMIARWQGVARWSKKVVEAANYPIFISVSDYYNGIVEIMMSRVT